MSRRRIKYIAGLVIIGLAFLYLTWTSLRASFQFALTPAELKSRQLEFTDRSVKVAGMVEVDSLVVKGQDYRFKIGDDKGEIVAVHFKGIAPNTFREGAEVVVGGRFDPSAGIFEATQILTKCASKYEEK